MVSVAQTQPSYSTCDTLKLMGEIIGIRDRNFQAYRKAFPSGRNNGAYYYAQEIEKNIIPLVKTDRNWDCLGMKLTKHFDHSIIFLHHNLNFSSTYRWLKKYHNLILVASSWATFAAAQDAGYKVVYLPLSVDTEYVKQFKTEKTKDACYAGNKWGFKENDIAKYVPDSVDFPPSNLPRDELLEFIAPYKKCYAIGRCAIEARVLGCRIMKCDSRYVPKDFPILDNRDAAKILQRELDKIDDK